MIKTEFMELLEELDTLYEDTDSVDAIIAEIEAGAKALLQDSQLQEATDLHIDNNDIEAAQTELDKDWKKSTPWIERVKTWFAEKVLNVILKNEKVYNALVTNNINYRTTEGNLIEVINSIQQQHLEIIREVAFKKVAEQGMDPDTLEFSVSSKDGYYSPEKFFVRVLELLKSGEVKDVYEAVRKLDFEMLKFGFKPKASNEELTEATDIEASKKFWAAAKNKQLDEVSFHAAFDDELRELGLMDVFKSTGAFRHSKVYGKIKAAKEANPDSWAVKALSKLWALRYVDYQYFESEKAEMRAEAEREAKERAEEEARWAEKERLAKEQRATQIEGYNKLLQTYISKVDPAVIAAYEKAAGVSVSDDVVIKDHKVFSRYYGSDVTELGLFFGTWGHYYKVGEKSINNESKMLDLLTKGLTEATRDLRIKQASERFKDIDVIAANKSATVILLGESGTLYELNSHQRTTTLRVNGKYEPADTIEEPYEVIYACTSWDDGNHSTSRDSVSQTYYSWNSKYADKLAGKIPRAYGRANGYLTSYIETAKVDGAGSVFSHADGIDSWAVTHCVACATD